MPDKTQLLILPNFKRRFSGITSTTLQLLPHLREHMDIRTVGYPLPDSGLKSLNLRELFRVTSPGNRRNGPVVFHARRNIDMVFGLILKKIFRRNMHLVFTSVAQRHHTRFTRYLYRRMDTLLSTSQRSASYLRRKPDAVIPHGIDIEKYHPPENRRKEWAETGLPGKYGIGIFGRVRPQKGTAEFVDALCRLLPRYPDFTAVIIGETTSEFIPFEYALRKKISDNDLENRFIRLGKLPFSEIPLWFRRMSLVAAIPHNEGFGLTCLEAMASGCPVVATQTGGFEMVIRDRIDGRIIPCRDSEALVRALDELLGNPASLIRMGIIARQRVAAHFSTEKEAAALLAVYRSIQSR